ncbi:predicted protein [Plenodomus lingam JN3]|uniref:Predicted protein n=1 Tax=Leptosphaeria maculans (strain JN3 / isolate v23.1.3 / race Av1-4-5-6-7-8) TaxID=985895 RepID=E5A4E0_LEPMJ|nr:predicted protein [Plenodomus lingam JN3]CBX98485.1 predicted protein [Plenodomus lingam JN3]
MPILILQDFGNTGIPSGAYLSSVSAVVHLRLSSTYDDQTLKDPTALTRHSAKRIGHA